MKKKLADTLAEGERLREESQSELDNLRQKLVELQAKSDSQAEGHLKELEEAKRKHKIDIETLEEEKDSHMAEELCSLSETLHEGFDSQMEDKVKEAEEMEAEIDRLKSFITNKEGEAHRQEDTAKNVNWLEGSDPFAEDHHLFYVEARDPIHELISLSQ